MLFSGKIFFVFCGIVFGVNEYSGFSLGKFLERSSGRIKFKLLLQMKKTLTKEIVEVKVEKHGL